MILYRLMTEQSMDERDMQIVLELLKDRSIDAQFDGFDVKIGKPIHSL